MPSRRAMLGSAATATAGLLAGCSILGGDGGFDTYPSAIPAPAAVPEYGFSHAERYEVDTIREHADLAHSECPTDGLGCTRHSNDLTRRGIWALDIADVSTVIAGGAHRLNLYPRTPASLVGSYIFKMYEYTTDGVASELESRYTPGETVGDFQLYTGDEPVVAADDGERLIVGVGPAVRTVAERLGGDHQSFADAQPDRATAREHLGTTAAEYVGQAGSAAEDDPDGFANRTVAARGVTFEDSAVRYRYVNVFESESALSGIGEAAVSEWAPDAIRPAAVHDVKIPDPTIERDGRTLVVTGRTDRYAGLI